MITALVGANSGALARFWVEQETFFFDRHGGQRTTLLTSDLPWSFTHITGAGGVTVNPILGAESMEINIDVVPTPDDPNEKFNAITLTNSEGTTITILVHQSGAGV